MLYSQPFHVCMSLNNPGNTGNEERGNASVFPLFHLRTFFPLEFRVCGTDCFQLSYKYTIKGSMLVSGLALLPHSKKAFASNCGWGLSVGSLCPLCRFSLGVPSSSHRGAS